jgi:hypothetical protein
VKCHFIHDDEAGKVWIPGCYSGLYTEGICSCRIWQKEQAKQWKENDPEYKARIENKELLKENARLHRIIEKLTNKKI